jgi:ribosomal protein S18 acetylase RimI-like enzyme
MGEATRAVDDARRIAAIHVASIDDSIPTLLGERYARAFFRYLGTSPLERILTTRVAGRIESVVVVSFEPGSLYRRVFLATLPELALAAVRATLTSAAFRRFAVRFALDLVRGRAGQTHAPEITYAFTSAELRGTGLGARLVALADSVVAERGHEAYFVRTADTPTNRAIAFYERHGFKRIERQEEGGRVFVVLRKALGRT